MRGGLAAALVLIAAGCPGATDSDTSTPTPTPDDRVAEILALQADSSAGQGVFSGNCTACHPPDGSQGVGPALSVAVPQLTDEEIVQVVLDGSGEMPTFDHLEDQRIANLLGHLRAQWD